MLPNNSREGLAILCLIIGESQPTNVEGNMDLLLVRRQGISLMLWPDLTTSGIFAFNTFILVLVYYADTSDARYTEDESCLGQLYLVVC